MAVPSGYKEIRSKLPESLKVEESEDQLGFTPAIPNDLPLGFEVLQAEVLDDAFKSLALRITDGLVKATVYEWRKADDPSTPRLGEMASVKDTGDLRILIIGPLPEIARKKILNEFNVSPTKNADLLCETLTSPNWGTAAGGHPLACMRPVSLSSGVLHANTN